MPKRLLPLILLVATVVLAGGCSSSSTAAITVNGVSYSQADFKEELEQLAPAFIEFGGSDPSTVNGAGPGSYTSDFTVSLLNQRVQMMLFQGELEERGLQITEDDRTVAKEAFFGSAEVADTVIATLSPRFAARFVEALAAGIVLQSDIGDDQFATWQADALATADVEVHPRFGTWDPDTQTVVGVEGAQREGEDETVDPSAVP